MCYRIYFAPVKPEGQAHGVLSGVSWCIVSFADDWQCGRNTVIAHEVTGLQCRWRRRMRCPCVLFVPGREGISFNPCTGASNDYSQSTKCLNPHFKSNFNGGTRSPKKQYSFYRISWVNPESERNNHRECQQQQVDATQLYTSIARYDTSKLLDFQQCFLSV